MHERAACRWPCCCVVYEEVVAVEGEALAGEGGEGEAAGVAQLQLLPARTAQRTVQRRLCPFPTSSSSSTCQPCLPSALQQRQQPPLVLAQLLLTRPAFCSTSPFSATAVSFPFCCSSPAGRRSCSSTFLFSSPLPPRALRARRPAGGLSRQCGPPPRGRAQPLEEGAESRHHCLCRVQDPYRCWRAWWMQAVCWCREQRAGGGGAHPEEAAERCTNSTKQSSRTRE